MTTNWDDLDICVLSELPADQCGCDRHRGRVQTFTGVPESWMLAAYRSRCPYCGDTMEKGQPIFLIDDNWCCEAHSVGTGG